MELAIFLATVVFISLSGVMAPGPLFAATLAEGRKNPLAGFVISAGHAIVEVPIILLLFLFGLSAPPSLKTYVGIAGGVVMLYLAYLELKSGGNDVKPGKALFTGIAMSALNPYFIMWWLTIGLALILKATTFGIVGLALFIVAHELCDFLWLGIISISSNKAAAIWGAKAQKVLTAFSVSILLFFGIYFIYAGLVEFIHTAP
ncbi:LysE family transporter [Archaeoglobus veneficus]|uniref:Lysine exporter protein (LYSE/YGGA) n=1 Tax=Archaeoglobus veneficus (strain DSM 11195 / SNP6) TaxID=693661 RepID=F2KT39_ARCVS|nr:LysE family transporter [Archaeoglobus veneficus]AEA47069.1 Lysine exporter protein (LYSE/YGGA) [Archaeoglobus veneficus SNP6]